MRRRSAHNLLLTWASPNRLAPSFCFKLVLVPFQAQVLLPFPFHIVYTVHTVHILENGKENPREPKSFPPRPASNHSETQLQVTEARSFTFFHAFSGRQKRSRPPRCRIRQRLRFLTGCCMSASIPVPHPGPDLPEDRQNNTAAQDCQAQPLNDDELAALIDFFLLLDAWDRKKKIV
jgi:hypothetical protein